MPQLRYSSQAKDDLREIQNYIARQSFSQETGLNFTRRLRQTCRDLASMAGTVGVARPELRADIRSHPSGNYVIFFRYLGDVFEVVTIIERHRDVDELFSSAP